MARWSRDGASSSVPSATGRSVSAPPDRESDPNAVREAIVREAIVRVLLAAAGHPTDHPAEGHLVEIATGREWAERTISPERWMDRSDCRRDVQRQERGADQACPARDNSEKAGAGVQVASRREIRGYLLDI